MRERPVKTALGILGGVALFVVSRVFLDDAARGLLSFILSAVLFAGIYRWHRREIHAGRREPVFFGKGKHYPPANNYVPFDKAITELGPKLERHPKDDRTN
jgi:hypothetical protein